MARAPVYSAQLGVLLSISEPTLIGTPPAGFLWVVREAVMTYGTEVGTAQAAVYYENEEPGLWLFPGATNKYFNAGKTSQFWTGRVVVPSGVSLWVGPIEGLTADFYFGGYILSAS